ncbi:uncharacterized protein N7477_002294 [Penicillium maclennaniae]|uniref:uncharacterized protein n=1 Tax=Penicillium maclennaniae TaxID=1343394 RepID=UPI00254029C4|nr:uncharacterized protein N7477_002294 [Penicillium maclennaniae]KAJ5676661.1 hypothetical protein N7477_002294 [Penicillium maclennaniae]
MDQEAKMQLRLISLSGERFVRLTIDEVDYLYLYRPNPQMPFAEQVADMQRPLGLSNSPPDCGQSHAMCDKPHQQAAMTDILDTNEPLHISDSEAFLHWLFLFSILRGSDGVILGASKVPQIVRNASDVVKGPLPVEVVHELGAL